VKIVITETQLKRVFLKEEKDIKSVVFGLLDVLLGDCIFRFTDVRLLTDYDEGVVEIIDPKATNLTDYKIAFDDGDFVVSSYFKRELRTIVSIDDTELDNFLKNWFEEILQNRTTSEKVSDAIKKRDLQ